MEIIDFIKETGVNNIGTTKVKDIVFEPEFRKACESNSCGMYGKCWTCPPYIGDIYELIEKAKTFETAIVYQTIHEIEDSFDIEGMFEAGDKHRELSQKVNDFLIANLKRESYIHLGSGGCKLCPTCSIKFNKPCVHPELTMASLESYGIAVSDLAEKTNMRYINGANTVTYFSAILLK